MIETSKKSRQVIAAVLLSPIMKQLVRKRASLHKPLGRVGIVKLDSNILCLGEVLGEGAFGTVMKGYTLDSMLVTVALKCIGFDKLLSETEYKDIYKESKIGRFGYSYRLVQCWGLVEAPSYQFLSNQGDGLKILVLEYCKDGDLAKCIKERIEQRKEAPFFSEQEVKLILKDLYTAIKKIWDSDLIHRDLKPDNLFLDKSDVNLRIKVGDFGLVRETNGYKKYSLAGTLGYMAPEVIDGGRYNQSADVYSIGAILYELIFGKPPAYILPTIKPCPEISEELLALVTHMIKTERDRLTYKQFPSVVDKYLSSPQVQNSSASTPQSETSNNCSIHDPQQQTIVSATTRTSLSAQESTPTTTPTPSVKPSVQESNGSAWMSTLVQMELEEYIADFNKFGIKSMNNFLQLEEDDWKDLNVRPFHRRLIHKKAMEMSNNKLEQ